MIHISTPLVSVESCPDEAVWQLPFEVMQLTVTWPAAAWERVAAKRISPGGVEARVAMRRASEKVEFGMNFVL